MWHCSKAHHRPSLIIESTTSPFPMRSPSRTRGRRYGQLLIDSMPPATATSMSPTRIAWSAIITALSPDPHTLLIVSAATRSGRPPLSAACRAGLWPRPAETTLPRMHSSTISGSMPARRTASRTTIAPSSGAVNPFSTPRNLPVGVRTALTITDSRMRNFTHFEALDRVVAEQGSHPAEDDRARAPDLGRPLRARRFDDEYAVLELHGGGACDGGPDRGAPCEFHLAARQRHVAKQETQRARQCVSEWTHGIWN